MNCDSTGNRGRLVKISNLINVYYWYSDSALLIQQSSFFRVSENGFHCAENGDFMQIWSHGVGLSAPAPANHRSVFFLSPPLSETHLQHFWWWAFLGFDIFRYVNEVSARPFRCGCKWRWFNLRWRRLWIIGADFGYRFSDNWNWVVIFVIQNQDSTKFLWKISRKLENGGDFSSVSVPFESLELFRLNFQRSSKFHCHNCNLKQRFNKVLVEYFQKN